MVASKHFHQQPQIHHQNPCQLYLPLPSPTSMNHQPNEFTKSFIFYHTSLPKYLNHFPSTFVPNILNLSNYHLAQDILLVLLLLSFCFLLCFWILFLCFNEIVQGFSQRLVLRQILCYARIGCLWTSFLNFDISQDLP